MGCRDMDGDGDGLESNALTTSKIFYFLFFMPLDDDHHVSLHKTTALI